MNIQGKVLTLITLDKDYSTECEDKIIEEYCELPKSGRIAVDSIFEYLTGHRLEEIINHTVKEMR